MIHQSAWSTIHQTLKCFLCAIYHIHEFLFVFMLWGKTETHYRNNTHSLQQPTDSLQTCFASCSYWCTFTALDDYCNNQTILRRLRSGVNLLNRGIPKKQTSYITSVCKLNKIHYLITERVMIWFGSTLYIIICNMLLS